MGHGKVVSALVLEDLTPDLHLEGLETQQLVLVVLVERLCHGLHQVLGVLAFSLQLVCGALQAVKEGQIVLVQVGGLRRLRFEGDVPPVCLPQRFKPLLVGFGRVRLRPVLLDDDRLTTHTRQQTLDIRDHLLHHRAV